MEKDLFTYDESVLRKIKPNKFENEKDLQDMLEKMINNEKNLLSHKIVGYKREYKSASGRPDFLLVDSDGRIIIVECKRVDNEQIRRKIIAQLIDYASDYSELLKINDWISLTGESVEIDLDNSEPLLCIISDGIHPELHRLNAYLTNKNLIIKLITINKFEIDEKQYYTITPHETEPVDLNNSYIEKLNFQINSFNGDRDNIRSIITTAKERFSNVSIKAGKKRIAIHINGSDEKFAIWLSQKGIRNIVETNISIPKQTFEPCSVISYNKVIEQLKINFKMKEYNHDDVMFYIALDDVIDSVIKLIENISDNIE
jgi:hypothetical protein